MQDCGNPPPSLDFSFINGASSPPHLSFPDLVDIIRHSPPLLGGISVRLSDALRSSEIIPP
jgi:hypothetical protein